MMDRIKVDARQVLDIRTDFKTEVETAPPTGCTLRCNLPDHGQVQKHAGDHRPERRTGSSAPPGLQRPHTGTASSSGFI